MTDQAQNKTISLSPSWKNHILGYTISILLVPVFGIGLLSLYWIRKQQQKHAYEFSDTQITSRDDKYQRNIDLANIDRAELHQSWLQKKMGVGNITLHTSATTMTLLGMENPSNIKQVLEKAIYAEKERQKQKAKTKPKEPEHNPGSMDKMDYLTGLWQQGLVSDEDYQKERKHFE